MVVPIIMIFIDDKDLCMHINIILLFFYKKEWYWSELNIDLLDCLYAI